MLNRFFIHQSNSLKRLALELSKLEAENNNPLQQTTIVVETAGLGKWLSQQIALNNGICSGYNFTKAVSFLFSLNYELTRGIDDRSLFDPIKLRWLIYKIITNEKNQFGQLLDYAKKNDGRLSDKRVFNLSTRIAELYDSYLIYRPDMLRDWKNGKSHSALPKRCKSYEEWQSILWNKILEYYANYMDESPSGILENLFRILKGDGTQQENEMLKSWIKKNRVIYIFGMSILPPKYMELITEISKRVVVRIFLLNPSKFYWGDMKTFRQDFYSARSYVTASGNKLSDGNFLLKNFGESGRDFFHSIYSTVETVNEIDCFEDITGTTLLDNIRNDILNWRDIERTEKINLPKDKTITVHKCYTPLREVEALYDYISKSFSEDSKLTQGDILILTPDIQKYSPLIRQQFANSKNLSVSIHSESEPFNSTFYTLVENLLDILTGRMEATPIIEFYLEFNRILGTPLSVSDEQVISKWIREYGIRWGIDSKFWNRACSSNNNFKYSDEVFSWNSGIKRILHGYSVGQGDTTSSYFSILEGSSSELIGELLFFAKELFKLYNKTLSKNPLEIWNKLLSNFLLTNAKVISNKSDISLQFTEAVINLSKSISNEVEYIHPDDTLIPFSIYKTILTEYFQKEPTDFSFLNGFITFASTVPMRTVPFKIVAFIGMNADNFPRKNITFSFDLMSYKKRYGDRNITKNDLYLFMETLFSAEKKLYFSYTGFNEKGIVETPPSSCVDMLLSYIEKNYTFDNENPIEQIVTKIPLHPFSERYSEDSKLYTYQGYWIPSDIKSSKVSSSPFNTNHSFTKTDISFSEIVNYFDNPFKDYYENILGYNFSEETDEYSDSEPFTTSALNSYILKKTLFNDKITSTHTTDFDIEKKKMYNRGKIPQHEIFKLDEKEIIYTVESLCDRIKNLIQNYSVETIKYKKTTEHYRLDIEIEDVLISNNQAVIADVGKIEFKPRNKTIGKLKRAFKLYLLHLVLNIRKECTSTFVASDRTISLPPMNKNEASRKIDILINMYLESRKRFIPYFGIISNELMRKKKSLVECFESFDNLYANLFFEHNTSFLTNEIEDRAMEISFEIFDFIARIY